MSKTQDSNNDISGTNWRMLGDFELSANSTAGSAINSWLTQLLSPLKLHTDFLNKVLNSAQEAAKRAVQVAGARVFEHIHLHIFATLDHQIEGQSWGFFRIEKIENSILDSDTPNHMIELYLYLERPVSGETINN